MPQPRTPRPAASAYGRTAGRFIAELVDKLETRNAELEKSLDELAEDLDNAIARISDLESQLAEVESLAGTNSNRLYETRRPRDRAGRS